MNHRILNNENNNEEYGENHEGEPDEPEEDELNENIRCCDGLSTKQKVEGTGMIIGGTGSFGLSIVAYFKYTPLLVDLCVPGLGTVGATIFGTLLGCGMIGIVTDQGRDIGKATAGLGYFCYKNRLRY